MTKIVGRPKPSPYNVQHICICFLVYIGIQVNYNGNSKCQQKCEIGITQQTFSSLLHRISVESGPEPLCLFACSSSTGGLCCFHFVCNPVQAS